MLKLESAINCLIKAASKVHPLIHAIKQSQPKPARKPRTKRYKFPDPEAETKAAAAEPAVTEEPKKANAELTASITGSESKRKHFAKGSQEAKDFMNMLRMKRKSKH